MKTWLRWSLFALLLLVLIVAGIRTLRQSQAVVASPASAAPASASTLELAAQDVVVAQRMPLTRSLDISGSLKAVNSAFVKARVAAEIDRLQVREGDTVRAGQELGRLDATEFDWRLRQAEQQAGAARAQLEIAQRQFANNKALVAQGFISPTALDSSASTETGAQATLQAALAAVELARKARADAVLVAPIAGLVAQRLAQPGERVAVDAKILEIVDLSRIELEAAIAPQDLAALRIGAQARLTVDGSTDTLTAQVLRINPSAQTGSRTMTAYLAVAPHPSLRHGLFARGWIALDQRPVLTLPLSAVRSDQAKAYAIRITDGRSQQRVLTLGARGKSGDLAVVEILGGLAEGDQVLAASAGLVPDGVALKLPAVTTAAGSLGAAAPAASARTLR